jgi:hypothetical protein
MAKKETTQAAPTYNRRKVSVEFIKLREVKEAGEKFIGTFLGQSTVPSTDLQGNPSSYERLFFVRRDPLSLAPLAGRVAINSDGGLMSTLRNALVKEGSTVEIEWKGKVEHDGGAKSVNEYDLWEIDAPALTGAHAAQAASVAHATRLDAEGNRATG